MIRVLSWGDGSRGRDGEASRDVRGVRVGRQDFLRELDSTLCLSSGGEGILLNRSFPSVMGGVLGMGCLGFVRCG